MREVLRGLAKVAVGFVLLTIGNFAFFIGYLMQKSPLMIIPLAIAAVCYVAIWYLCETCEEEKTLTMKAKYENPELKEMDIDDMIEAILDMGIMEDNEVSFTEEAKNMIHAAAEKARQSAVYINNIAKQPEEWKEAQAEDLFVEMLVKIVNAPTKIHMIAVPRLMLPAIDDAIRRQQA